jgi:hypothetical protein
MSTSDELESLAIIGVNATISSGVGRQWVAENVFRDHKIAERNYQDQKQLVMKSQIPEYVLIAAERLTKPDWNGWRLDSTTRHIYALWMLNNWNDQKQSLLSKNATITTTATEPAPLPQK